MFDLLPLCVVLIVMFLTGSLIIRSRKLGDLSGRYVFITGCDTGFGNMLAKRLDSLGMNVFAGCLTPKGQQDLEKATSKRLVTVALDVTNEDSIRKAYAEVKQKLPHDKGLWGLVNNAGVAGNASPLEWQTIENYRKCNDVNLYGMINVTTVFLPLVRKAKGRVVSITSIMGRVALVPSPYVVSKYGAEGFCDCLRYQLYNSGVTVHIIEPGFFKTAIINIEDSERDMRKSFQALENEQKEFYGEHYISELMDSANKTIDELVSPNTYKVVDAFTHALTAVYPRARYVVGFDANIQFRLIWTLPEWIGDRLVTSRFPKPAGCQNR
ncbi:short-chain dehydrogenase/reductase family 9C member 7-like [Ylistrum balloti]|uniref:short-chain dehydrogenase/reductase family 9C member 7-like n=1 Tax=Ylistrum balloti TaxID=509963 RepID=UPI002905BF0C|nr:short-chain dehydrogenase/reductase family 9C member 7-like [Ylistrum balloti]